MSSRRPAILVALAFAAGIAASPGVPRGAEALVVPALGIVAVAPLATSSRSLLLLVPFVLGVARGFEDAPRPLRDAAAFAADSVWVGRVVSVRERSIRLERVRCQGSRGGAPTIRGRIDVRCDGTGIAAGSWVRVAGRIEAFEGSRNPGRPDPRSLARQDRVVAFLKATGPPAILRPARGWRRLIGRAALAREEFARRQDALYSPAARPFLRALFLGDRSLLDDDVRAEFRDVGAAHLVALSGEHVTLVALFVERALLMLRVPFRARLPAAFGTLAAYLVLTSAPASVTRAGLAFALVALARPLSRRLDARNGVGVALLVLLAVHPEDLWDAGLLLSFGATAGLLFLYPRLRRAVLPGARGLASRAVDLTTATVAATLPLLPLEARLFEAVPLVGPLTNPILVPWTGLVLVLHATTLAAAALVPASIAGTCAPGPDLAATTEAVARGVLLFVRRLADRLPAPLPIPSAWLPLGALYLAGGALLLAPPAGLRARRIVLLPLAALVAVGLPIAPALRIVSYDVGQGDAILAATPWRRVLIDAGPRSRAWDTGERVVLPGLGSGGGRRLDAIVLSHADADHCGGAAAVLRGARVGRFYEPDPGADPRSTRHAAVRDAARERGVRSGALRAGDRLRLGRRSETAAGVRPIEARVVWPSGETAPPGEAGGNPRSIVLDLHAGRVRVLLTGDLPGEIEDRLAASGAAGEGSILKVAHHGSRSSTSGAFLRALRPPAAILSAGKGNRYGHPHPAVLDRLGAAGAAVMRTDRGGAITIETDGKRVRIAERLGTSAPARLVISPDGRPRAASAPPRRAVSAPPASPD